MYFNILIILGITGRVERMQKQKYIWNIYFKFDFRASPLLNILLIFRSKSIKN